MGLRNIKETEFKNKNSKFKKLCSQKHYILGLLKKKQTKNHAPLLYGCIYICWIDRYLHVSYIHVEKNSGHVRKAN